MKERKIGQDYLQQGDVLLKRVDSLPPGLTKVTEHKILQYGETTHHFHGFDSNAAVDLFIDPSFLDDSKRITPLHRKFIVVTEGAVPAILRHQEHRPFIVPPGTYEIDIVREYDYEKDETVRVVD